LTLIVLPPVPCRFPKDPLPWRMPSVLPPSSCRTPAPCSASSESRSPFLPEMSPESAPSMRHRAFTRLLEIPRHRTPPVPEAMPPTAPASAGRGLGGVASMRADTPAVSTANHASAAWTIATSSRSSRRSRCRHWRARSVRLENFLPDSITGSSLARRTMKPGLSEPRSRNDRATAPARAVSCQSSSSRLIGRVVR
jgi:hypothetical protein